MEGKTVAVIGSLDTKESELSYMVHTIEEMGMLSRLYDASGTRHSASKLKPDITNTMLVELAGSSWQELEGCPKNIILATLTEGLRKAVYEDYQSGLFQGIISAGGMQNTLMAKTAMEQLPYGFPKINVAPAMTVVEIDDALGRMDDVATVNSIADIGGGINAISAAIISNGLAALKGLMEYGAGEYNRMSRSVVGIMNLGVMAQGASQAAQILNRDGIETCLFHGTMHGAIVEKLVREGTLKGVMMLCVHDILTEALDAFRFCRIPVLKAPAEMRIPTLVSLSGMDVIDMSDVDFCPEKISFYDERKYHFHNDFCVHVKVTKEEILRGGALLAERLNEFRSPLTLVIPLRGFRSLTQPGEPLYDPEVDQALIDYLHTHLQPHVHIVDVDANANDPAFSRVTAREMEKLMGKG